MNRRASSALSILTLASLLFAGCLGADEALPSDPSVDLDADCSGHATDCVPLGAATEDGRDLRYDLLATDEVPAPTWKLGDVFEVHFYFGNTDTAGSHVKTAIVEDLGDSWMVATTDQEAAKEDATWDIPIMGPVTKSNLATSGFNVAWDWMYQFPLTQGKSWESDFTFVNFNSLGFEQHSVTFTATFDDGIETPYGTFPGYLIEGVTEFGRLLSYDYVPAIAWFSDFWVYDQTTEDPDDWFFHALSMGIGHDFEGEYYLNEGKPAWGSSFRNVPIAAAGGVAPPMSVPPTETFTLDGEATYLRGVVWSFAVAGSSYARLEAPDGTLVEVQADHHSADLAGFGFDIDFPELVPAGGEWRITNAGAGAAWGAGGQMTEVFERKFTFPAT